MKWLARRPMLLLALGLTSMACSESAAENGARPEGKVVLELVDAEMLKARVRASKAPLVFVNTWATWCQPCIEEFPALVRFQKTHRPPEAELLFVSTDFASERRAAEAFYRGSGAELPGFIKKGGDMEFIDGLSSRWSGALPATFLFDRQGNLLELWQGKVDFDQLEAALAKHRKRGEAP